MEIFIVDNKILNIKQEENEPDNIYLERCNYILGKLKNDRKENYKDIITKSHIWKNTKFYNISYPKKVIDRL